MFSDGAEFRPPRRDEHVTVVGRNGTGKTILGVWLLSLQDYSRDPWVMVDYKRDETINAIRNVQIIKDYRAPRKPGLFKIYGNPGDDEYMNAFLWDIYKAGHVGIYLDEGYMVPAGKGSALRALYTQGRSKRIPVITLSQRPLYLDRYAFSEASHHSVFDLNDRRDWSVIQEFTPEGFSNWLPQEFANVSRNGKLPKYHSRWYNVKDDQGYVLRPVPEADRLIDIIEERIPAERRWF